MSGVRDEHEPFQNQSGALSGSMTMLDEVVRRAVQEATPQRQGTLQEQLARLDSLSAEFGMDAWNDSREHQDVLFDWGGLPA